MGVADLRDSGNTMNKRIKRTKRTLQEDKARFLPEGDEHFVHIAGYTSGGAPYGITWEEHWASQEGHDQEPDDPGDVI
ncbi:MAG: hypothetical protein ED859_15065 [Desulfuromonadales bacterium]|nr:MAG: hypothetical protein ED859_15065 [Desulfuromonadales bacterium]